MFWVLARLVRLYRAELNLVSYSDLYVRGNRDAPGKWRDRYVASEKVMVDNAISSYLLNEC